MPRKSKNQQDIAIRANNLKYPITCPYCNCRYMLNNTSHFSTAKHLNMRELFLIDNPEFKESSFTQKLINLKKIIGKFNYIENDISKFINVILTEEPNTYDIDDIIEDARSATAHCNQVI
jgi:hypothetical protein